MLRKLLIVVFVLGLSVSGLAQKITSNANTTVYVTTNDLNVREIIADEMDRLSQLQQMKVLCGRPQAAFKTAVVIANIRRGC